MKYIIKSSLLLLFLLATTLIIAQPLSIDSSPNTSTCNLDVFGPVTISVPTEVLTGDNIDLNITLPGTLDTLCTKTVTITRSSNLSFQSSGAFGFASTGTYTHENTTPLPGNHGQNFNVFYKFPNYVTCDGAVGTFDVTVTATCPDGSSYTCTSSISVIARAANYWTIEKEFVTGDLTCGISKWRIRATLNNPNGTGLGTYRLTGTITETTAMPIVSGAIFTLNRTGTGFYYVYLENCSPESSVITNTADYDFTLGNSCGDMEGSISADSPPLVSPNASISFTKTLHPSTTNLSPGCDARYRIRVCNNGNVPWTELEITDNLVISGITPIDIIMPGGWTMSPGFTGPDFYTFEAAPGFVLGPGDCQDIYVYFTIDAGATVGSIITNTANISYQADGDTGGPGGGGSNCPGIVCPSIDMTVQNDVASNSFEVEEAEAIPSIKKCILDPPTPLVSPIYQIGDVIKFRIMVGNSGAGPLTTMLTDELGFPAGQDLTLDVGSVTYSYYEDENRAYRFSCNPPFGAPDMPLPFPEPTIVGTSPLTWEIIDMPGTCEFNKSNFLMIEFEATIAPQLSGTKTNTATIPDLSSAVNYTVDQVGILAIDKRADVENAEIGDLFDYIITVRNDGSVPLDNIVITDDLPDCVSLIGVSVVNDDGSPIPHSTSGGLTISMNPAVQIMPGESYVITINVMKTSGSNCCNISASVTAEMTTSGVELNAVDGSEAAPAACVRSTACCDIPDFDAEITFINGEYIVTMYGGGTPIQEVEISMMDYHVDYLGPDCQPDDLGIFGTLSSASPIGGLILDPDDNGTHILNWLPGSPVLLDHAVSLDITDPLTLAIDCCEMDFSFCLKVRVKDVNCNVCEKTVCYSPDQPEPQGCDIDLEPLGLQQSYCPGNTITLNWTGAVPPPFVNIYLEDVTNSMIYSVLATGISNTGTFSYTIPADIPCNPPREWAFRVEDVERECQDRSETFWIECCEEECRCGSWDRDKVMVYKAKPNNPQFPQSQSVEMVRCQTSVMMPQGSYTLVAPDYTCEPESCNAEFSWKVVAPSGGVVNGLGQTLTYNFMEPGNHLVTFSPNCGTELCNPCSIGIFVEQQ